MSKHAWALLAIAPFLCSQAYSEPARIKLPAHAYGNKIIPVSLQNAYRRSRDYLLIFENWDRVAKGGAPSSYARPRYFLWNESWSVMRPLYIRAEKIPGSIRPGDPTNSFHVDYQDWHGITGSIHTDGTGIPAFTRFHITVSPPYEAVATDKVMKLLIRKDVTVPEALFDPQSPLSTDSIQEMGAVWESVGCEFQLEPMDFGPRPKR